jgi:signal transduction histidine kinase
VSHSRGISKYEINTNSFRQVYAYTADKKTAQFIGEDDQQVYCYTVNGNIIALKLPDYSVSSDTKTGFPDYTVNSLLRPTITNNIIDHRVGIRIDDIIYCWDLRNKQVVGRSPAIRALSPFFLRMRSGTEVLYYDYISNNALHLYNFDSGLQRTMIVKGKDMQQIGRCIIFSWQNKTLISFNERLFEFDISNFSLGAELVSYQNEPIGGKGGIARMVEDNFGNLCLTTINMGIKKVIGNNYPVNYYGSLKKNDNNNILSILPDKKSNRILAGTSGNGLMIFDTLQRLVKHIRSIPGDSQSRSFNCIIKDNNGNYILFCNSDDRVWQLSADLSSVTKYSAKTSTGSNINLDYFGNPLYQDEKKAIVQSQGRIFKVDLNNRSCTGHEFTTSYTMGGLYYNGMIISHANDELIFLDAADFRELKKVPFKNTGYVRCFAKDAKGNILVGSNKGIFIIDSNGKIMSQLTKKDGLPDECIYAMVLDEKGAIWCSSNKGIFKIKADNSILQLKKEDGLQENEFNTNVVARAEDGELFFGGVNGVSSFYPAAISSFREKINLFITNIRINNEEAYKDRAVWSIQNIRLPYDQNSLAFDFVAMANNNPGQYSYQYRMEGMDKAWIQNSDLQTVRYNLPPGRYVFQVYAARFFDRDAKPMKEIRIIITPPFWKSWWFILGMIILAMGAVYFSVNRYNKRRYEKKLLQLEAEHKVQLEKERISRDLHDSIGAYANAVLYNTELLQQEPGESERQELMNDLRFASKDIITSLRETIWALKKENYTPQECLLRIKNFVQPFTRYYQHIQFRIEGDASDKKVLDHNTALNLVRLVQEAVNNAIKHGSPTWIVVKSKEEGGRWMLSVENDGKGFDYETIKDMAQGNGLANMKQRADESGFQFSLRSEPGQGTKIQLVI